MKNLIFLTCFFIFAILAASAMIIMGYIFNHKKKCYIKSSRYECGIKSESNSPLYFDMKYFNYVIVFLIIDSTTIFLYPFLTSFLEYSINQIVTVLIFWGITLITIFISFKYKFIGDE